MENDETLEEFVQILGRIKDLLGETAIADDEGFDLARTIEQMRLTGNNDDADEIAELLERAEALKALHQAESQAAPLPD